MGNAHQGPTIVRYLLCARGPCPLINAAMIMTNYLILRISIEYNNYII